MTEPVNKFIGDSFGARVDFEYQGPAKMVWVGIGIAYGRLTGQNVPFAFAAEQINIPETQNWAKYTINVDGQIPVGTEEGQLLDIQVFVSDTQPVVNQQPRNDYNVNYWSHQDVYAMVESAFRNLTVVTYY